MSQKELHFLFEVHKFFKENICYFSNKAETVDFLKKNHKEYSISFLVISLQRIDYINKETTKLFDLINNLEIIFKPYYIRMGLLTKFRLIYEETERVLHLISYQNHDANALAELYQIHDAYSGNDTKNTVSILEKLNMELKKQTIINSSLGLKLENINKKNNFRMVPYKGRTIIKNGDIISTELIIQSGNALIPSIPEINEKIIQILQESHKSIHPDYLFHEIDVKRTNRDMMVSILTISYHLLLLNALILLNLEIKHQPNYQRIIEIYELIPKLYEVD